MEHYQLVVPCHFGLESVLKREIIELGYEITRVEDGRITFEADAEGICRANIGLRTAERVLLQVGRFRAETFEELFDKTNALAWDAYIPSNGRFWVKKANSVNSKLFSPSDIQSIIKKAIVEKLKKVNHTEWFAEDGEEYPLRVSIIKDEVIIGLDTTGRSLHKRGYRTAAGPAPISETLAAALILLTPWKKDRILVDPFCGSGTFLIEAAMMAANMAPGINRDFTAQHWDNLIPSGEWESVRQEARNAVELDIDTDIQGYDIDDKVLTAARQNAMLAGTEKMIHFQKRDVCALSHPKKYGFIITNPPYGERLEDKEALPAIYSAFGQQFAKLDTWSAYVITSYEDVLKYIGRKADKNRKIYNGMIKTYYYQFLGPKPPKRRDSVEK